MTFGLVDANYSLPEWQAVKLTFFAFLCTLFGEKNRSKSCALFHQWLKRR